MTANFTPASTNNNEQHTTLRYTILKMLQRLLLPCQIQHSTMDFCYYYCYSSVLLLLRSTCLPKNLRNCSCCASVVEVVDDVDDAKLALRASTSSSSRTGGSAVALAIVVVVVVVAVVRPSVWRRRGSRPVFSGERGVARLSSSSWNVALWSLQRPEEAMLLPLVPQLTAVKVNSGSPW